MCVDLWLQHNRLRISENPGMQETAEASSPVVQQLLQEQIGELLGQKPLDQFCRQYCKQHAGTSVRHATAAARGLVLLDPSAASEAAGLITGFDVSKGDLPLDAPSTMQDPRT